MKTIKEQIAVMQHFADGGEVECTRSNNSSWVKAYNPSWDWINFDYRISEPVDPYAELKAAAKDPTKQIRCYPFAEDNSDWEDNDISWYWSYTPDKYQIRDKPKPVKKVKFLAYVISGSLIWVHSDTKTSFDWKRVPSEDKEVELQE